MRKIAYPETTDLKPSFQPVKTKGSLKKLKPTPSDTSTVQSPSYFEHVDNVFPESPTSKTQKSVFKGARISQPPPLSPTPKISFIDEMMFFMHKYIEWIVNVEGDDNCGYRFVSALLSKWEDNLVRHKLIHKSRTRKESYTRLYGKKEKYDAIYESFVPCIGGPTPEEKWTRFPEISHLIACGYDKVCIDVFSETFFPQCTAAPQNPNYCIVCIWWLSKSRHFVQVYLKPRCVIPLISPKWATHSTTVETWSNQIVERMQEFEKLSNIER